jgi:sialic acid synthase SpsE
MNERFDFLGQKEPYVIAEVGGNHGGSVGKAKEYIRVAAETGVDSVKFQLYQADSLITKDEPPLPMAGDGYDTQFERFRELELTHGEWREVIDTCYSEGVEFSASVFDTEMLDLVIDDIPFIKIASGDMTNLPLLRYAAEKDKPILLSTGFSSFEEIRIIMEELSGTEVLPLHCVGCYPAGTKDAHLSTIERLRDEFTQPVGYSDHTVGVLASITAVAKGAQVVEKHFTLDKSQEIGDHRLSANPEEMQEIVEKTRLIRQMNGNKRGNEAYACESNIKASMRRSLAAANVIKQGERFKQENVTALRPSGGISPLHLDDVIDKKADKRIEQGEILRESYIS